MKNWIIKIILKFVIKNLISNLSEEYLFAILGTKRSTIKATLELLTKITPNTWDDNVFSTAEGVDDVINNKSVYFVIKELIGKFQLPLFLVDILDEVYIEADRTVKKSTL